MKKAEEKGTGLRTARSPEKKEEKKADLGHEIPDQPVQLSFLEKVPPLIREELRDEKEFARALRELTGIPLNITITRNRTHLITVRGRGEGTRTVRLQAAFLAADDRTLRALARYIMNQDRRAGRVIDEFIRSHAHLFEAFARESGRQRPLSPAGRHYNLEQVLKKVAKEHGLQLRGIRITWGGQKKKKRKRRSIKFGTYCRETKTITIHPLLDSPEVPDYFLEFIVYHELGHAIFPPAAGGNGRREVHGTPFKRFEKRFRRYREAVEFEKRFAKKILG